MKIVKGSFVVLRQLKNCSNKVKIFSIKIKLGFEKVKSKKDFHFYLRLSAAWLSGKEGRD